jgi:hypothetical protein
MLYVILFQSKHFFPGNDLKVSPAREQQQQSQPDKTFAICFSTI